MKQLVTSKSGTLSVVEVPAPALRPGFVLVRARYSLVSAGTEGAQVREGKADLVTKIREHPREVRQVLAKLRKEGFRSTAALVQDRLSQWRPLGYSLSGEILEVGEGVADLAPGDRVACAGAGYAVHAEIVAVPRHLVARVPEGVELSHAAFATLGAIALHGVRQAAPTLGETGLVVGLGLVGQLSVQLLRASGVRVAVSDPVAARVDLATRLGAELAIDLGVDPGPAVETWTQNLGFDLVLLCAATPSSDPVRAAAKLLRDRGRLVVVGDVGLDLERAPFYMKELSFSVSRSYGPGRYDPLYEEGGVDYPAGFVRWTEGRNLGLVLDLLREGRLHVGDLLTETRPLDDAPRVYEEILAGRGSLGTLLTYAGEAPPRRTLTLPPPAAVTGRIGVLVSGVGTFARAHHLPNLAREEKLRLAGVVAGTGTTARQVAEQHGAAFAGTDFDEALAQPGVDAVLIATRHHLHVPQALAAIRAGKHVLLEKPMALDEAGLRRLAAALHERPVRFAVGFNRRQAPLARELRERLRAAGGPLHGTYRVNAGRLPATHWVNNPEEGGGRLLGEGCHMFDFFNFLTGSRPLRVAAGAVRTSESSTGEPDDVTATVTYEDGSVLTLLYVTTGPSGFPKEQIEIFASGLVATLTDFRRLAWTGGGGSGEKQLRAEDKGQAEEMRAWARYLAGEPTGEPAGENASVVGFEEALLSTWLTLRAREAVRTGTVLEVAATLPGAV